jgi:DNA transposition AAA+ family ATPase
MSSTVNKLSLIEQGRFITDKPDEILQKVKALVERKEIKLSDIRKFTGYSAPTISQVLSRSYEGDVEKLQEAVVRFFRSWVATTLVKENSIVDKIHGAMLLMWRRKAIGKIIGPFGRGKSVASSRFGALNSFAAYVELTSTTSVTAILHRIAEALGIESQMIGSRDDKLFAIIRSLQRNPRLLIIDEADNLDPRTIAILKDVHGNDAAQRCGIVLIGTDRLNEILRLPELGYLRSRIGINLRIGDLDFEEAREIADIWPHDLDEDELSEAWSWALKRYGTRSLAKLMERAYDHMQLKKKSKIDSDCLKAAYAWLVD